MNILLKVMLIFWLPNMIPAFIFQFFVPLDSPIRLIWICTFIVGTLVCGVLGSTWLDMEEKA